MDKQFLLKETAKMNAFAFIHLYLKLNLERRLDITPQPNDILMEIVFGKEVHQNNTITLKSFILMFNTNYSYFHQYIQALMIHT